MIREAWRIPVRNEFFVSFDGGDPWGSTISHLFAMAEVAYLRTGEVWEDFRPSPMLIPGDYSLPDDYPDRVYWDDLEDGRYTVDELHAWYRILLRYDSLLRLHGLAY